MWTHRIRLHSDPRNLLDSEDITERVFGGDTPIRSSVLRRGQLLELIAARLSIRYGLICSWCENAYHPAFIQKIIPRNNLGKLMSSSEIITPDNWS